MQGPRDYLAGLAELAAIDSVDERRRVWRQGLASLAMAASNQRVAPLEALRPERLAGSVQVAFRTGLVDDVKWMSPGLAAAAFFEIAAVLPPGEEKRELGRRVLEALLTGDAATFALLATSLAGASRRGLSTPPVRARLAVSMRLPVGIETGVDRLALALLSRPDLERAWLTGPSTGPLPARRVAARLLERAAREAARRAQEGDDVGTKTLARPSVRAAFARLLADREALIWRHVAGARGLLAAIEPALATQIERDLSPQLGPTEWRRAVTSLGASVAHAPAAAVDRCQQVLHGELPTRDPGLGAAMIFGLSRAAAGEPEAVEALLPLLLESGDLESIEAFVDLLAEHPGWPPAPALTSLALDKLRAAPGGEDEGLSALRRSLDAELSPLGAGRRPSLRQQISAAQQAFVEGRDLRPHVEAALATAGLGLGLLERMAPGDRQAAQAASVEDRARIFTILRELDRGLLESSVLADLLAMVGILPTARGPGDLGDLITRLRSWLVQQEGDNPPPAGGGGPLGWPVGLHERTPPRRRPATELEKRRLRALVHAIDGEGFAQWDDNPAGTRERRLRALDRLLARLAGPLEADVRRPITAALARACEGLSRDELAELGELLLLLGDRLTAPEDFAVLAEATLAAEAKEMYVGLGEVMRRLAARSAGNGGGNGNGHVRLAGAGGGSALAALAALADSLPPGITAPVEALRRALVTTARTLERVAGARSLLGLVSGPAAGSVNRLGECVQDLGELVTGVWRRLGQPERPAVRGRAPFLGLDATLLHVARGTDADLGGAVAAAMAGARADLPAALAEVVASVLAPLARLPIDVPEHAEGGEAGRDAAGPDPDGAVQLPSWLPPSRVTGGFYVQRPLGRGTVGSVFVVCRAEDRHDPQADRFALKIPTYDGSAAHTLSEQEFLRLFREEAGALLTLPAHPHLAEFVTFDARAKPKPILVMELVDGPTLERVLQRRDLTLPLALGILDGVAAGLEAMHALGIGHLDVKPANVILRAAPGVLDGPALPVDASQTPPVLVDFGLAGRKVRPGCASPFYGAPEVWVTEGLGPRAEPPPADVYSFCCLAFELLVGRQLFTGDTLPAVVAAHYGHDGDPARLSALRDDPALSPIADLLARGLRADPSKRLTIADLRRELAHLAPTLSAGRWPLAA